MVKLKKNLKSNKDYSLMQLYYNEGCSINSGNGSNNTGSNCGNGNGNTFIGFFCK